MNRSVPFLCLALTVPCAAILACGASVLTVAENSDSGSSSTPDGSTPTGYDGAACCPRDSTQAGCMNLGGAAVGSSCSKTCDFYCSTNWRVEKDNSGCEVWRYDVRAPKADENSTCFPKDAGGPAECSPACSTGEVCVRTQIEGGFIILVDDAGACPAGRHPEGDMCERDPAFKCETTPNTCTNQLDCTCAESLCSSISSCSYFCASTQNGPPTGQVNCLCQTP